jgi:hypothetical protein
MATKRKFLLLMGIIFSLFAPNTFSQTIDSQKEALNVIADFADRICPPVPISGSSENLELSGEAKIELNNLLKKIADLGIKGAAKYQESHYKGVLQKDLAVLLQHGSKCKLEVWKDLKDKLLVSDLPPQGKQTTGYNDFIGSSYQIRCHDKKEGNIFSAIIQFTSISRARWRYKNGVGWEDSLQVESLSPHKVILTVGRNDPNHYTWDFDFSDDFLEVTGSLKFLQTVAGPTRWRDYEVKGFRIE